MNIKNDNGSNGCINYSGTIHYYNIPDFLLQHQNDYIALLKKEIEELKSKLQR